MVMPTASQNARKWRRNVCGSSIANQCHKFRRRRDSRLSWISAYARATSDSK